MLKRLLPVLAIVFCVAVGLLFFRDRAPKVEVVIASTQNLAEVLALSGRVRGVQESQLAPEVTGTIRRLFVSEGEVVKQGQKLAELDLSRLEAQLGQAREKVRVAQAQLKVVSRGPLPSQLKEVRSEVEAEKLVSAAAVESARQTLLEAQRGPRTEQISAARATLEEARAEADQKSRESARMTALLADGAVSHQSAEQTQSAAQRAKESTEAAAARLAELENGTRPEQVEQARQALASAQANLLAANQAGDAKVRQLLDQPRSEDVALATAQLKEAQSAVLIAQERMAQAEVLAPYDGVVGRRLLRVGDVSGPGEPLLTFSSRPTLEIRVDVDESDRARLVVGLQADIRANGYPDRFQAKVRELSPEVDPVRGTLEARLSPVQAPKWLVPGQTVDVNLILGQQEPRLVLPLTCVILKGEQAEVVVVEEDTARLRAVEISSPTQEGYLIRSGIKEGDRVVLYPQGITEGQKIRTHSVEGPR